MLIQLSITSISSKSALMRVALLAIAATGGAAARAVAQQGPPPAAVRVDAAAIEQVQERRMVTGELRAVQRSRVATEEPGLALQIPVQEGQAVKKGDLLAQLDPGRLEIELKQTEADRLVAAANVTEREAEVEWRKHELENHRALAQGGAGKAKELYDAEMEVRTAAARLESAKRTVDTMLAREELLKKRIADTAIVAPYDGVIVSKAAEEGEWVAEGAAVVEMIATSMVDAWLDVPQQFAIAIAGRESLVTIVMEATGQRLETSNLRIIPQVDPKARTFSLVARLENAERLLTPGMSVTAWVPTGELGERLTISRDAIMRSDTGSFVYVARQLQPDAPPSAMPADVQVLFGAGERMVVQSPTIQAGDLLVVEGNERLFPTAPIIPQAAERAQTQREEASPVGAPQ
jgi:RND family efflux transporter MFP subunit